MLNPQSAEEHLRVIRSLMEKATVYRAISAHAAVVAGGLALAAAFLLPDLHDGAEGERWAFRLKWLVVLMFSALANFYFLHRDSGRRGEAFISAGMRMAFRAMSPALLFGGVFTILMSEWDVVPFWQISYGLALLSTVHFAPRSLERLGWSFLLIGLSLALWISFSSHEGMVSFGRFCAPDVAMAGTFGLFHLIYAAFTWPRTSNPAGK
jgi:hypothetical protein